MSQTTLPLLLIALTLLALVARRGRRHSWRYATYLHSPLWRARRRVWILQAHGRCQDCGRRRGNRLTIHHLTYRRLGHEHRGDVRVLCWPCHQRRHHHASRHR
jgi:hypothetical protein